MVESHLFRQVRTHKLIQTWISTMKKAVYWNLDQFLCAEMKKWFLGVTLLYLRKHEMQYEKASDHIWEPFTKYLLMKEEYVCINLLTTDGLISESFSTCLKSPNEGSKWALCTREKVLRRLIWHLWWETWAKVKNVLRLSHL